jgi:hypothetical protein
MDDPDKPPIPHHQLDLFGDEEVRRRELETTYESLAHPPETFTRLVEVMKDREKREKPSGRLPNVTGRPDPSPRRAAVHR